MNNFKPIGGESKKEEGRRKMGDGRWEAAKERVGGSIYMYMGVGCP